MIRIPSKVTVKQFDYHVHGRPQLSQMRFPTG